MLKDAGRGALGSLAEGLQASACALARDDADAAGAALERLRAEEQGTMSDLAAAREKSAKVARRTLRGRQEAKRFARLDARIGELDLLSVSVLLLSRATHRLLLQEERDATPGWLAPAMSELVRALQTLAEEPELPDARLRASDAAAGAAREVARAEDRGILDPRVALVAEGLCLTASDVAKLAAPEEGPDPTA